jgi:ZIP family zinc transporter
MGFAATAGLGAIAGFTIFLGLPVARSRPSRSLVAMLNSASVGVLLFLFFDIVKNATEQVDTALAENRARGIGYGLLLAAGLAIGLLSLVVFERLALRRRKPPLPTGPGALAAATVAAAAPARARREPMAPAVRVALFIAVGIGLHNFSEGLAIGQAAHAGSYQQNLLWVLVIGFGLHNITEGFGITGPIVTLHPSWRLLGTLGLIGGGPTLVGTVLGYQFTSVAVSVLFLSLAAGAIVYVIGELQHAGRKIGAHDVAMVGLLTGFLVAYGTDLVLHAAGA